MRRALWIAPLVSMLLGPAAALAQDVDPAYASYQRGDYEGARKALAPRAENGDPTAQYLLGLMYEKGRGVERDTAQAARWYERAAIQGEPRAQNNLGVLLRDGDGVQRSTGAASRWFTKAARQGNVEAQNNLGALTETGADGVTRDVVEAYAWYSLAAQGGSEAAARNRDALQARMSTEQALTASRRAQDLSGEVVASAPRDVRPGEIAAGTPAPRAGTPPVANGRRPLVSGSSEPPAHEFGETTPARAGYHERGAAPREGVPASGRTPREGVAAPGPEVADARPSAGGRIETPPPTAAPPGRPSMEVTPAPQVGAPLPRREGAVIRLSTGPLASFEEVSAVEAGRALRITVRADTALDGIRGALGLLEQRLGRRPRVLAAIVDERSQEAHALLEGTDGGAVQVRGIAVATARPGLADVVVIHDAADRLAASHEGFYEAARTRSQAPLTGEAAPGVDARTGRPAEPIDAALERSATVWGPFLSGNWPTRPAADVATGTMVDQGAIEERARFLNQAAHEERFRAVAPAELNR